MRPQTVLPLAGAILTLATVPAHAAPAALDTATIIRVTHRAGAWDAGAGVFKLTVPRTDLAVTVAGARMTPPQGIASWAAFEGMPGGGAMVMGDLVLAEDQVGPVMLAALDHGLEVTALHNHFLWDTPRVMFMHVGGMGDVAKLAAGVSAVFDTLERTAGGHGETPSAAIDPRATQLDTGVLATTLGHAGTMGGGVYKVVVGRTVRMHGMEVAGAMGVTTWAAFAGTDARAVVDGDFAVLEDELQDVLKTLRHGGIDVVAIHQHMTGEAPRMLFLHYWGVGSARALATTLRAALDRTAGSGS